MRKDESKAFKNKHRSNISLIHCDVIDQNIPLRGEFTFEASKNPNFFIHLYSNLIRL